MHEVARDVMMTLPRLRMNDPQNIYISDRRLLVGGVVADKALNCQSRLITSKTEL